MALQDLLKPYQQLVQEQITAVQANATDVIEATEGSDILAMIESNATLGVWLQSIAIYLYGFARASTSASNNPTYTNPDLDSWMQQFGFDRLPATYATTLVTFSRTTTTQQAVIGLDVLVTTQVGNINYQVIEDSSNPNWNETLNAYVMPSGSASITVPVQASAAGASGNVVANQINLMVSAVPYVQSVTNPNPVTNGQDVESDLAYLQRFQLYINSLSKATPPAIDAAIEGVQDGILYNVIENQNYSLTTQLGFFTVIIDDGTGAPPDSLVTAVNTAISTTRGLTIQWGVYKTVPVPVPVSMNLLIDPAYDATQIILAVETAITAYIDSLNPGEALDYTKLPNVIYLVSKGILNIQNLQVNSGTSDVQPTEVQSVKAGTFTITYSNPT